MRLLLLMLAMSAVLSLSVPAAQAANGHAGRKAVKASSGKLPKAGRPAVPRTRAGQADARKATRPVVARVAGRAGTKVDRNGRRMVVAAPSRRVTGRRALAVVGAAAAVHGTAGDGFERAPSVSIGDAIGLHRVPDPLALRSSVALVIDPQTAEVLYEKNAHYVLPIASLTKIMTAMVVLDAGQPLDEVLAIDEGDRDRERASRSWLPIGSRLTRRELLQLALMSSENRAASALARHFPGGLPAFVAAANAKAKAIGMDDSVFADGTGLSANNVSTATDLARMVQAAGRYALIRDMSTASSLAVRLERGTRVFGTTNRLVGSTAWHLDVQKTGYISEAGNCLIMQGRVERRQLVMVLLDSYGRHSRLGDAERIRRWIATDPRARGETVAALGAPARSVGLVAQR